MEAAGIPPGQTDTTTTVITGRLATIQHNGDPGGPPNLVLIESVEPQPAHTGEAFWERLQNITKEAASTNAVCVECHHRPAEYSMTPQTWKPWEEPEADLTCAHCALTKLWEMISSPPVLERITLD